MRGRSSRYALPTALVALALFAVIAPARAEATEESTDDRAITTVLQPGWNMVGWLGADVAASEIFDEVPNLERISAWDAEHQRYQRRSRNTISRFGLRRLAPGRGLLVFVGGDDPVKWTRTVAEDSVLLQMHAGRNLVAWAGRDGTPVKEAFATFGDTFVHASLWDAPSGQYLRYHPGRESASPLLELNHGDALWVELTGDARWWQSGTAQPPVEFLGEFTEDEQAEIRAWVDSARAILAERWSVEAPVTVYVGDLDSVTPTYRRVRGHDPSTEVCGNHRDGIVFLILKENCRGARLVAHEYFHAIQEHLSRGRYNAAPDWLIEGSAEYAESAATGVREPAATDRMQLDRDRDWALSRLVRYRLPSLNEIERGAAFDALPDDMGYRLGFLAVGRLVERSSEQSLLDFFEALGRPQLWQEAFEGAFGITVSAFHEEFETYRAVAAPPLLHLMDDIDEPRLVFVGEVPDDTRDAVSGELASIRAFFEDRLGAGAADYTVYVGADEEATAATHLQAFGYVQPESFCYWSTFGTVTLIALDCRSGRPYGLAWFHFRSVIAHLTPSSTWGPWWLVEAVETYVQHAYHEAEAIEDYDAARGRVVRRAAQTAEPLQALEARPNFHAVGYQRATAVSFLAGEWLVARAGETALLEYYRLVAESETWEEAFEAAFEIAVDDFYEAFEAYRAEVAPPNPDASSS